MARGSRGCRRSDRHHPDDLQVQGAVGEDLPGMEGPGGLEEKRNCVEGGVWAVGGMEGVSKRAKNP